MIPDISHSSDRSAFQLAQIAEKKKTPPIREPFEVYGRTVNWRKAL